MLLPAYRIHRIFTFCNFELSGDSTHLEALTVDASEKLFAEAVSLLIATFFPLVLISHITLAPKSCKFSRFIFRDILT